MRLRLPFRADSLLGLIHTAPGLAWRRPTGPPRCHPAGVPCQRLYRAVRSALMRILLLAQFFPPDIGGEERHVFNLANTLAERGHDVAVATHRMVDVPDQETLASGVRVHRFATAAMRLPGVYSTNRSHHPPLPDPLGVRELSRIIRQERPHVVHAHNWIVNSAVALRRSSPTGSRFGLVLTLHDFSHVCATKRLMRMGSPCEGPAVARCLPCATAHYGPALGPLTAAATGLMRPWKNRAVDHVVCVSNAVASGNRIPRGPNTSIIPNFVPDEVVLGRTAPDDRAEDIWTGLPKEEFLLFVGELSRDKGLPTLLRAYESLRRFEADALTRHARLGDRRVIVIGNGGALPPPRTGTVAVPGRIVSIGRLRTVQGTSAGHRGTAVRHA